MILIYKQFNLRNAAKWGKPKRARCTPLQTPGGTQRSKLQSICRRRTLPGDTVVTRHSVPLGAGSVHALGWRALGKGAWEANIPGGFGVFFCGEHTYPILSQTCFPFLLSALLPPLLLSACFSRSAPVILSSLPSARQRRSVSPKLPVKPSSAV